MSYCCGAWSLYIMDLNRKIKYNRNDDKDAALCLVWGSRGGGEAHTQSSFPCPWLETKLKWKQLWC